jgi:hypothetical protein
MLPLNWRTCVAGILLTTTGCCSISVGKRVCDTPACESTDASCTPSGGSAGTYDTDDGNAPAWQSSSPDVQMRQLPPGSPAPTEAWQGGHSPPRAEFLPPTPPAPPAQQSPTPITEEIPPLPGVGAKSKSVPQDEPTAPRKLLDQAKDWIPSWPKPKPITEATTTTRRASSGKLDRPSWGSSQPAPRLAQAEPIVKSDSEELATDNLSEVDVADTSPRAEYVLTNSAQEDRRISFEEPAVANESLAIPSLPGMVKQPGAVVSTTRPLSVPAGLGPSLGQPLSTSSMVASAPLIELGQPEFIDEPAPIHSPNPVPPPTLSTLPAGTSLAPLPILPGMTGGESTLPPATNGLAPMSNLDRMLNEEPTPRVLPMSSGTARPLPLIIPAATPGDTSKQLAPWPPLAVEVRSATPAK